MEKFKIYKEIAIVVIAVVTFIGGVVVVYNEATFDVELNRVAIIANKEHIDEVKDRLKHLERKD